MDLFNSQHHRLRAFKKHQQQQHQSQSSNIFSSFSFPSTTNSNQPTSQLTSIFKQPAALRTQQQHQQQQQMFSTSPPTNVHPSLLITPALSSKSAFSPSPCLSTLDDSDLSLFEVTPSSSLGNHSLFPSPKDFRGEGTVTPDSDGVSADAILAQLTKQHWLQQQQMKGEADGKNGDAGSDWMMSSGLGVAGHVPQLPASNPISIPQRQNNFDYTPSAITNMNSNLTAASLMMLEQQQQQQQQQQQINNNPTMEALLNYATAQSITPNAPAEIPDFANATVDFTHPDFLNILQSIMYTSQPAVAPPLDTSFLASAMYGSPPSPLGAYNLDAKTRMMNPSKVAMARLPQPETITPSAIGGYSVSPLSHPPSPLFSNPLKVEEEETEDEEVEVEEEETDDSDEEWKADDQDDAEDSTDDSGEERYRGRKRNYRKRRFAEMEVDTSARNDTSSNLTHPALRTPTSASSDFQKLQLDSSFIKSNSSSSIPPTPINAASSTNLITPSTEIFSLETDEMLDEAPPLPPSALRNRPRSTSFTSVSSSSSRRAPLTRRRRSMVSASPTPGAESDDDFSGTYESHVGGMVKLEDGTYLCGCGRGPYQTVGGLRAHAKLHGVGRPFGCANCGKTFQRKQDLKRHEITHEGLKPFRCVCGVAFSRSDALQRHIRSQRCG
ncbi:hypothetical protein HDU97_009327 [Phlyctochytrium planicorne]|nr:hypothetical protein HDU97_009327 [Phlyctochytrium planicorne]